MRDIFFGAVLSIVMIPFAAHAVPFQFEIENVDGNFEGTLSGIVDGLTDNVQGQAAASLVIETPPLGMPGMLTGPIDFVNDFGAPLVNSFSVSGGLVTSASFAIQVLNDDLPDVDPDVFESLIFTINTGILTFCCGVIDNGITFDDSFTVLGNRGGPTGTEFKRISPIPLPAGAPLLFAGLLGLALLRGKNSYSQKTTET